MNTEDAFDFFNQLSNKNEEQKQPAQVDQQRKESNDYAEESNQKSQKIVQESVSKNINWDVGTESIIKRCLLTGQLEEAAECALKCGRHAEAFLIADFGGDQIFRKI